MVLEDIFMGKLNNLPIGLDICTTVHQDISLDDLEDVQDEVCRLSSPGYLMALPTQNDPMLSYYTTDFHDHLRLRKFNGLTISPAMKSFYVDLGVITEDDNPLLDQFGSPQYVYFKYLEAKNDSRFWNDPDMDLLRDEIFLEADSMIGEMRQRNVLISEGSASMEEYWIMDPDLEGHLIQLYDDAKKSVWKTWHPASELIPKLEQEAVLSSYDFITVSSKCGSREEYLNAPSCGEDLSDDSSRRVRSANVGETNLALVISDGLNPFALTDENHVVPFLKQFIQEIDLNSKFTLAPSIFVGSLARVRFGYDTGRILFQETSASRLSGLVHLLGERPGTGHHAFSAYVSVENGTQWDLMDHQFTDVVAGMSDTSLSPTVGAARVIVALDELFLTQSGD